MEMTWMETVQLLGLDLLVLMLMALVVLDRVEQTVHSAWVTALSRMHGPAKVVAARGMNIGTIKHV